MYKTLVNKGINYLSTGAGFLPSTVCQCFALCVDSLYANSSSVMFWCFPVHPVEQSETYFGDATWIPETWLHDNRGYFKVGSKSTGRQDDLDLRKKCFQRGFLFPYGSWLTLSDDEQGVYNHLRNARHSGSMKPFSEGEPGSLGFFNPTLKQIASLPPKFNGMGLLSSRLPQLSTTVSEGPTPPMLPPKRNSRPL